MHDMGRPDRPQPDSNSTNLWDTTDGSMSDHSSIVVVHAEAQSTVTAQGISGLSFGSFSILARMSVNGHLFSPG